MNNWILKRKVSFALHVVFLVIPLGAGTISAYTVWSALFGDPFAAIGLIMTLEVLALTGLILHVTAVEWPLAWLRHILPFFSMIPLGYELYTALTPQMMDYPAVAGTFAVAVTGWSVFLAFQLLHSLERLFIDPIEAVRERARDQMETLQRTLSSWQEATGAVQDFVMGVQSTSMGGPSVTSTPLLLPSQPTMPLLQAPVEAHPKMHQVVGLASLQDADGTWTLSMGDIQQETRVSLDVIEIITKLVRTGQLVAAEASHEHR